ncbi:hypothetical protein MANES_10G081500v8 [Manihot esculenta]|uniref:Uncharacterized protein n=1 Tax=Manihot esculenta TaxID=3983 RepID=A0ACB7H0E7_MANES|nr:hypothetical protein MANES_10G081500v8 [Manihot esculenta]
MEKSETTSSGENPRPWHSYHTVYTNAKAGMEGVDKEKVQRIVYEMSKGSKYFENEEKKEAYMRQKIETMRAQCAKLTAADVSHYQMVADKRIVELETTRDLSRIWLHVDMDAFYAAVETLSNPSLTGKPMAVGSMSMISTANYEARKFGVRAAMPGFIARKLCPELIFVPTDFNKYTHYSNLTRKVFQKYDPHFMAASLDEAYLDITDVCKERGVTGGEVADELRTRVYEETGLTCSAGVAPNRLLAKIGGIGKVTEHMLRDVLGINTCEEMLQKGGFLCALFSRSSADFFLSVGLGLGGTDTPEVKFRKSISNERTFSATDDEALLYQKLADIAQMLCTDMQKEGLRGRTLTLKLKTASFEVRSRAVTLQKYICSGEEILKYASKLLKAELPISLRLIGLRMSHFNEDKAGAPSDPTQRTLTKFVLSRDASGKTMGGQSSLSSNCSDEAFMDDLETSFPNDEIRDPWDSSCKQDLEDHNCTFGNNIEAEEAHESLSNNTAENIAETSLPRKLGGGSTDMVNEEVILHNEAVISPDWQYQCFKADDYKCSLCGIEMPPDFVEERQEHSDFHLAERLQEKESSINSRTSIERHRFAQKAITSSRSSRKKHKPSPKQGSHLSIDMYFVKSNQNF